MNEIELNKKFTRNLIVTSSQRNSLKCTSKETQKHMDTKYALSKYCWPRQIEFFTEAEIKTGGRADFIISDWKLIIEVYETEIKKSLLDKSIRYPQGLGFIPLKAGTAFPTIFRMLDDLSNTNGATWEYYYKRWGEEMR